VPNHKKRLKQAQLVELKRKSTLYKNYRIIRINLKQLDKWLMVKKTVVRPIKFQSNTHMEQAAMCLLEKRIQNKEALYTKK